MKTPTVILDSIQKQTVDSGKYIREIRRRREEQRLRELDVSEQVRYSDIMNGSTRPSA
jgi:hypothetical protein